MAKLAKLEITLSRAAEQKVNELLVFDARCTDIRTRQELLRLLPGLVHISRSWRAHFLQQGCLACHKPNPTVAIAARLRRRGSTWAEIYEITAATFATRAERKRFESAVRWKLAHLDIPTRKPSHRYGAGGFCDRCYLRLRRELAKALRKMQEGRDTAEEIAALSLRFSAAQRLLNGDDADFAIGGREGRNLSPSNRRLTQPARHVLRRVQAERQALMVPIEG
ncbi:MAG: hypothetical protein LAO03_22010 [Acidobacteriia bacterium]|nr:hypothetical protein [Terriglobia bacterium]